MFSTKKKKKKQSEAIGIGHIVTIAFGICMIGKLVTNKEQPSIICILILTFAFVIIPILDISIYLSKFELFEKNRYWLILGICHWGVWMSEFYWLSYKLFYDIYVGKSKVYLLAFLVLGVILSVLFVRMFYLLYTGRMKPKDNGRGFDIKYAVMAASLSIILRPIYDNFLDRYSEETNVLVNAWFSGILATIMMPLIAVSILQFIFSQEEYKQKKLEKQEKIERRKRFEEKRVRKEEKRRLWKEKK